MKQRVTFPGGFVSQSLDELQSCSIDDVDESFRKNGYAFVRGLIPAKEVELVRQICLDSLISSGNGSVKMRGNAAIFNAISSDTQVPSLLNRQDLCNQNAAMRRVLEAPELRVVAEKILKASQVSFFGYKWLRAVSHGLFTGFHIDETYLNKISSLACRETLSVWLPLGQISPENGALVIANQEDAAHFLGRIRREGQQTVLEEDGTISGWIWPSEEEISGIRWYTAQFEMGDAILFGPDALHCTAVNTTDEIRISCDVRISESSTITEEVEVGRSKKHKHE